MNINVSEVLNFMRQTLPEELYIMTADYVQSYLSQRNSSLLIISIVIALWSFSKSMSILQKAMNKAYGVNKHRDVVISRAFGIFGGVIIMVLLYLSVAISAFGTTILEETYARFHYSTELYNFLNNSTLPILALVTFAVLIVLYALMPNIRIKKLRYVLPGAIFSVFVLVFLTSFAGRYVSNILTEDSGLVNSLVMFVPMIWFIFISRVLIMGAMINAVYQKHSEGEIETHRTLGEFLEDLKKKKLSQD